MRVAFRPLFRVRLRHAFYSSGQSTGDFEVRPSPATKRVLDGYGLVFRKLPDGLAVYGEVTPRSDPPTLARPLGEDALRLRFLLQPANAYLPNISSLPDYRAGRELFYFNNLRDDQADGRLHLGDSVAGARVGVPVRLVSAPTFSYFFPSPVSAAELTLDDMFGTNVHTISLRFSEPTTEYRVDLDGVDRMQPGRYLLSDNAGGSEFLYYDPALALTRPFAVIEIFSRTDELTTDQSDLVPADYRFLAAGELLEPGDYHVQFESRTTTWRYLVHKAYETNDIDLDDVIVHPAADFTKTTQADPPAAVFTSNSQIALRETAQALELRGLDSVKLRTLPSPGTATPLQAGASPGQFVSDIYVYV